MLKFRLSSHSVWSQQSDLRRELRRVGIERQGRTSWRQNAKPGVAPAFCDNPIRSL